MMSKSSDIFFFFFIRCPLGLRIALSGKALIAYRSPHLSVVGGVDRQSAVSGTVELLVPHQRALFLLLLSAAVVFIGVYVPGIAPVPQACGAWVAFIRFPRPMSCSVELPVAASRWRSMYFCQLPYCRVAPSCVVTS